MLETVGRMFLPDAVWVCRPEGPEAAEVEKLIPYVREYRARAKKPPPTSVKIMPAGRR